jgi:hypothetical protein
MAVLSFLLRNAPAQVHLGQFHEALPELAAQLGKHHLDEMLPFALHVTKGGREKHPDLAGLRLEVGIVSFSVANDHLLG